MLVTPIVLLLLLALLLWGAWWGYQNVTAPPPSPPVSPCVSTTVGPKLASWRVTVNVYNGGHRTGAASEVAKLLKGKGFKIGKVANTDRRVTTTVVEGRALDDPSLIMVKGFFNKSTAQVDERSDGSVDVYIGTQYGGFNAKAPNVVQVSTSVACLQAKETPTPTNPGSPNPTPTAAPAS